LAMNVSTFANSISANSLRSWSIFTVCPPTLMARRRAMYLGIGTARAGGGMGFARGDIRREPRRRKSRAGFRVVDGDWSGLRRHRLARGVDQVLRRADGRLRGGVEDRDRAAFPRRVPDVGGDERAVRMAAAGRVGVLVAEIAAARPGAV